jgi:hypothetical protein
MKAGQFNINDYLERLYEESTAMMAGGEGLVNNDGIIIPEENKKSYDWLKKEYQANQTEVKVEINMGGAKFEPGYDLQTDLKSVKDFKPGMFGEVKTKDNSQTAQSKGDDKQPLDAKKGNPQFTKGEGDSTKKETPKTNVSKDNIKNKEEKTQDDKENGKETEEKKEKEEKSESNSGSKPEVKKIDLKTKKN